MNYGQSTLTEFVKEFIDHRSIKKSLLIQYSEFKSINSTEISFTKIIEDSVHFSKMAESFDLVFADLPFGMKKENSIISPKQKINGNWNTIISTLELISTEGVGLFIVEPIILSSRSGKSFIKDLKDEGYFLNAVLKAPEKIYAPETNFSPILISLSKRRTEKLFITELELENVNFTVSNYLNNESENLATGLWVDQSKFESFNKFKIQNEIRGLKTQYKEFRELKLSEISASINVTRNQFQDIPNSIYIPKIGNSKVTSSSAKTSLKHQNYFQIVLNKEIVLAEYLEIFYKSELGQLILDSLSTGNIISHISKTNIQESYVAIPDLNEQKLIIHTNSKLNELQYTIDELQQELSLNPKNSNIILEKFESIQAPLKSLTIEDEILALIRKGESKIIEFKETFSKNIHTNKKDKEIEKSSLKNIVGFLNADGGTLLIGVSDSQEVTGIENDFFQSNDKYLLNFKNALNTKIGSEFYPLIDYEICSVLGKKLLKVECKPSKRACFYDGREFYVRTNPATDKLEGRQLIEYIERRFPK